MKRGHVLGSALAVVFLAAAVVASLPAKPAQSDFGVEVPKEELRAIRVAITANCKCFYLTTTQCTADKLKLICSVKVGSPTEGEANEGEIGGCATQYNFGEGPFDHALKDENCEATAVLGPYNIGCKGGGQTQYCATVSGGFCGKSSLSACTTVETVEGENVTYSCLCLPYTEIDRNTRTVKASGSDAC